MKLQHEDSKAICDRELTMAEEMLIARAHVQMVYHESRAVNTNIKAI